MQTAPPKRRPIIQPQKPKLFCLFAFFSGELSDVVRARLAVPSPNGKQAYGKRANGTAETQTEVDAAAAAVEAASALSGARSVCSLWEAGMEADDNDAHRTEEVTEGRLTVRLSHI